MPSLRAPTPANASIFSIFSWFGTAQQNGEDEHWDISTASSLPSPKIHRESSKSWSFFEEGEDDLDEADDIDGDKNESVRNANEAKQKSSDAWFSIYQNLCQNPEQFIASISLPQLEELFIKALYAKKIEVANILIRYGIEWRKPVYLTSAKKWVHPVAIMKKIDIRDFHEKKMIHLFQTLDLNPRDKRSLPRLRKLQKSTNSIAQTLVQCMLNKKGDVKDCLQTKIDDEKLDINLPLYTKLKGIDISSHPALGTEGSYRLLFQGLWLFPIDIAVILGSESAVQGLIENGAIDNNLSMYPSTTKPKVYLLRPRNLNLLLGEKDVLDSNRYNVAKVFRKSAADSLDDSNLPDSSIISWYKDQYPSHSDESPIKDEILTGERCLTPNSYSSASTGRVSDL